MSNPRNLGSLCHEAESSWGEDTDTYATLAHPLIEPLNLSLSHTKMPPEGSYQRRNEGSTWILGGIGGSFTATYHLYGNAVTMVGSPTISPLATYFGRVFGTAALSATASDTATGGTASVPTMTGATGFSAGSLCSFGTLGDGDGNGQVYAIGTHAASNLTLLTALDAEPANGAVVRPVAQVYPSSSPTSNAITGTRFRWQTGNMQYGMHGCFPMSVDITGLNPGEIPKMAVTWGVSWWEYLNDTFPNTVTAERGVPAVNAAGSLQVQTVGTVTRNKVQATGFTLSYTLGVVPITAPGGVNAYQTIVGATRINDEITFSWTQHADATSTTPATPALGTATNSKHVLLTLNTIDSKQVSIYMRNTCITAVPIQMDVNGVNSFQVSGRAYTGTTTTNDLTLSPFVLGLS